LSGRESISPALRVLALIIFFIKLKLIFIIFIKMLVETGKDDPRD
jgi:hypothetical protein